MTEGSRLPAALMQTAQLLGREVALLRGHLTALRGLLPDGSGEALRELQAASGLLCSLRAEVARLEADLRAGVVSGLVARGEVRTEELELATPADVARLRESLRRVNDDMLEGASI